MADKIKILFFISGIAPKDEEIEAMEEIKEVENTKPCFRNALYIDENACLESCNYVFGDIPKSYSEVPTWGEEAPKEKSPANAPASPFAPVVSNLSAEKAASNAPTWSPNA